MTDKSGRRPYGARQIMDITHHAYRFYCERIIRKLMEVVKDYSCVIGFQLDNETKHFGTSSENVQQAFVSWIKKQYQEILRDSITISDWITGVTELIAGSSFQV